MSYLVLARKYRPKTFGEVVGQDVVVRLLAGAIQEERVGHAYLFSGPRGTGKTTSARLFAKALNCERGPTPEPCGECERCRAADQGGEADLVEIDAASNTGVDHVRVLRDQAAYVPLRARFKVYLIDEVHMLSKPAFNALLKTLEEPPPHVKFLFATTEPQKVPDTILSRCQVVRLGPIGEETIAARLEEIFVAEGVDAEEGVTRELARRARGGMRDALSMADQLLSLVGTKPRAEDVARLGDEGSSAAFAALADAIVAGDRASVLENLPSSRGGEAEFLGGLLDHLRGCLLVAVCGRKAASLLALGAGPELEALANLGERVGPARLEAWLAELLAARERMRLLPSHARLALEVTLLDLCRPESTLPLAELAARLQALESRLDTGASAPPATGASAPPSPGAPAPPSTGASAPPATRADRGRLEPTPARRRPDPPTAPPGPDATARRSATNADTWEGFLAELSGSSASLGAILERRGRLVRYADDRAVVQLSGLSDSDRALIADPRNRRQLSRAFSAAAGREVEVVTEDATGARPGMQDPFTREVADLFEGHVEE